MGPRDEVIEALRAEILALRAALREAHDLLRCAGGVCADDALRRLHLPEIPSHAAK